MSGKAAYRMAFEPLVLKEVCLAAGITQQDLADGVVALLGGKISRATMNLCFNRGRLPARIEGFTGAVERIVGANNRATQWLLTQGLKTSDIWQPAGREFRNLMPALHGVRSQAGMKGRGRRAEGEGQEANIVTVEVEMIKQEALKHFRIFRNPFIDDITKDSDIYMSEEHRYIEAAMLDAARHGGFLAVIGEVGSGKSVMRRKVIEQLKKDGDMLVVYPQMIDKSRVTAASICDAIIQDVSSEKCRVKLEDKTRQVHRLLIARAGSKYRACLIIEEAHDLSKNTLKYLKRFYELEDGYRKLLGIILIGQQEMKIKFDERENVDMREVIRRVQVAEIRGLNGHLKEYLSLKFKRVGREISEIMTDDAFEMLGKRLTSPARDGRGTVSHAYPLLVNNYTARAMNLAWEMGEERVTAEVVEAI